MVGCRPLHENEITLVLSTLPSERDRTLFVLGLKTGFRISELLSLKVQDVYDHDKSQAKAYVYVARKSMKGKTQGRSLPLHQQAKHQIEIYLRSTQLGPSDFLFPSDHHPLEPMSRFNADYALRKAFKSTGLEGKLATHSMRKTFAHSVYERVGRNIFNLQKAMGHKNINSTVSYIQADQELIEAAILA